MSAHDGEGDVWFMRFVRTVAIASTCVLAMSCTEEDTTEAPKPAENIYAELGAPLPTATPEQLASFERGKELLQKRFTREDGLGPQFNVTFCGSCHEKPVFGGSAPRYRNFLIVGNNAPDGSHTALGVNGIQSQFSIDKDSGRITRTPTDPAVNNAAARNGIPFFGVGLIAEIYEESILANADPDDADGDGISGRPNYDRGFVGRFGRKSQTTSIEGFIRGPLNNHLGITTNPLSNEMKAKLPVPSALTEEQLAEIEENSAAGKPQFGIRQGAQAAAPSEPTVDDDGIPDPELSEQDLFDIISFSMLLAAPEAEPLNDVTRAGKETFESIGCASCHVESLNGSRGLIPLWSDLLLHDMGPDMADGLPMGVATASEFRTAPLWGVTATGPYLHDGRADTLEEAISHHGGEADAVRQRYNALSDTEKMQVLEFLQSLGGRAQRSEGLLPPNEPIEAVGEYGGPYRELNSDEQALYLAGRAMFDRDIKASEGLGPKFNGDACRACHFEPHIGGAGPLGLSVTRQGIFDDQGQYTSPHGGTILHRFAVPFAERPPKAEGVNFFELRQPPHVFGIGLIDRIPEETILAGEDPDDEDGDGIRGVSRRLPDGRLARFGWKLDIPSTHEFMRDALTAEVGLTLPERDGQVFGHLEDDDAIADPEISDEDYDAMLFYMETLGPPPRQRRDVAAEDLGEQVFEVAGCGGCHTPSLPTDDGTPVNLYSDLLLHDLGPEDAFGIPDDVANNRMFRTAPLWGIGDSAPYMHDGRASTLEAAIEAHGVEAKTSRDTFLALDAEDQAALIAFLKSL